MIKNHARLWYFTHVPGAPAGAIALNFSMRGDIADVYHPYQILC